MFPTFDSYLEQPEFCWSDSKNRKIDFIACKMWSESSRWFCYPVEKILYSIPTHEIRETGLPGSNIKGEIDCRFSENTTWWTLKGRNVCNQSEFRINSFMMWSDIQRGQQEDWGFRAQCVQLVVFKDFAHSPSKLKATTEAPHRQFQDRTLVACMELHYLQQSERRFSWPILKGAMDGADIGIVYFNCIPLHSQN